MEFDIFNEEVIAATCILVLSLLLLTTVSWIRISERKEYAANRNKERENAETIGRRIFKQVRGCLGPVMVLSIILNNFYFNIVTYVLFALDAVCSVYEVYRGIVTHDEKKKVRGVYSIVCLALMYTLVAYINCSRCS